MKITVNGQDYSVTDEKPLLSVLREEIGMLSVKEGCDDATCGTCVVIANGKLVKSCSRKASTFENQEIITTEGLSEREKDVYVEAFGEAGAVQCGFCIPGMVMAGKVLLDKNPDATREDVTKGIRLDVCRCTGYKKVEDAILSAGQMLRDDKEITDSNARIRMSDRAHRPDAAEKTLGTGLFTDDIRLDGMIHAKALRTKYPRALINAIDTSKAKAHPDCVAVLTAEDVPENKIGHIVNDWDVMIRVGDITRYVGDALALVATADEDKLDEILALIEVDYTELDPVTTPQDALRADAPFIHERGNVCAVEHVSRGDVRGALARSAHVVTRKFTVPWQEHAFLEPECAVAEPVQDGLRLHTSSQSVYDEQREISRMLKLPADRVRSSATLVGGGFGGKEDMTVQHHAGADGLAHPEAGEGEVLPSGEPGLPRQAAPDGHGVHGRLRREGAPDGPARHTHLRHRGIRLSGRTGPPARLHARRRAVQLPERRHPGYGDVHEQPGVRRIPRIRRRTEPVRDGGVRQRARRDVRA